MSQGRVNRREFPVAVQVAIVRRATDKDGQIHCEQCGAWMKTRAAYEIDHVVPEAMRSPADRKRRLTAAEGQLLCKGGCHKAKTRDDQGDIGKAKRREAKALGVEAPGKAKVPYAGKPAKPPLRTAPGRGNLSRRYQ